VKKVTRVLSDCQRKSCRFILNTLETSSRMYLKRQISAHWQGPSYSLLDSLAYRSEKVAAILINALKRQVFVLIAVVRNQKLRKYACPIVSESRPTSESYSSRGKGNHDVRILSGIIVLVTQSTNLMCSFRAEAETSPPWARAIDRVMANPNPAPSPESRRAGSTR
jgi:hypothetical protein